MLLSLALVAAMNVPVAKIDPDAHRQDVEQWRAARVERLKRPDGWLSLVGLHWIEQGTHSIGSGKDNDIVLNVGPAKLGTLVVEADAVRLQPAADAGVTFEQTASSDAAGAAASATATTGTAIDPKGMLLQPDSTGAPTFVRFGSANFHVIERSGKRALRVKDANAETLKAFTGMDNYDIDPAFRFDAQYIPHEPGKTIPIASITGSLDEMKNPGAVVFWREGKEYRIEAVDEGDGQLFLIFADRTSGKTTYGAGRFLYADPPKEGSDHVVVDFNKAYNPPCVFTPYATCPLAPPENRLDLAIEAGEKNYAKAVH